MKYSFCETSGTRSSSDSDGLGHSEEHRPKLVEHYQGAARPESYHHHRAPLQVRDKGSAWRAQLWAGPRRKINGRKGETDRRPRTRTLCAACEAPGATRTRRPGRNSDNDDGVVVFWSVSRQRGLRARSATAPAGGNCSICSIRSPGICREGRSGGAKSGISRTARALGGACAALSAAKQRVRQCAQCCCKRPTLRCNDKQTGHTARGPTLGCRMADARLLRGLQSRRWRRGRHGRQRPRKRPRPCSCMGTARGRGSVRNHGNVCAAGGQTGGGGNVGCGRRGQRKWHRNQ